MFSSAGERDSLETLRQFEKVRDFFVQAMGVNAASSGKTRLVVFGSGKAYEPYKLKGYASAWYMQRGDRDTIVMGNQSAAELPMAIHEYVHLVTNHAGLRLPPWLNEGLAEVYSTFEPSGDKVLVGKLIPGRMQAVQLGSWKLREVLQAGQDSPLYNEKDRVSAIYNVGWALTHMLALSADYRSRFPALMAALQNGVDSIDAIQQIYGTTPEMLEKRLNGYIRSEYFQGSLFPVKLMNVKDKYDFTPAGSFDIELTLLDLSSATTAPAARKASYLQLTERYPTRPEPEAALGYLYLQGGESGLARLHLQKAVELGAASPKILYDYARLISHDDPSGAAQCLRKLLQTDPGHIDARIHLAGLEIQQRNPGNALAALKPVQKVSKQQAPGFFRVLTYAQLESGLRKDASISANRWKQNATDPNDQASADRVLALLARGDLPTGLQREADFAAAPNAAPRLTRSIRPPQREEPASETPAQPEPSAEPTGLKGQFVELSCLGAHAVLRIQTPQGRKSFLIRDGGDVILEGAGAVKQEFDCGQRKTPLPVEVFFEPESGYDGRLTTLKFLPQ